MAFTHGVYIQELPTKLFSIRECDSSIPFIVGTAPKGKINEAQMAFNYVQAVELFGEDESYTIPRFLKIFFALYGMGPVAVAVASHRFEEVLAVGDGGTTSFNATLGSVPVVPEKLSITDGSQVLTDDGNGSLTGDGSGTVNYETGEISFSFDEAPSNGASIVASYRSYSGVTAEDIIGGVDDTTGERYGLELIEEVFPRLGIVPGIILAPGFLHDLSVANAMIGKAQNISGHFKAMAYIDVPSTVLRAVDAVNWKRNFNSPFAVVFFPQVFSEGEKDWLSCHAAGLTAQTDWKNSNIPYESPSNKSLLIEGPVRMLTVVSSDDGRESEANYLNSQGIVTVLRAMHGWKLWGNRTAAYPENTDIKDKFIPCRRMANWIENNLILSTLQKVDDPMNRRLIETVVDSVNVWLNGLVGRGFLLGARVKFLPEENPLTDLADGKIRFHIFYCVPPPAETIEYVLEVDVNYFSALFESI